jgi:hypothetical protein
MFWTKKSRLLAPIAARMLKILLNRRDQMKFPLSVGITAAKLAVALTSPAH